MFHTFWLRCPPPLVAKPPIRNMPGSGRGKAAFDKRGSQDGLVASGDFDAPVETPPTPGPEAAQVLKDPSVEDLRPEAAQSEFSETAEQVEKIDVDRLNDQEFNELHFSSDHIHALRSSWSLLLNGHSPEGVGELIHVAFQESMPSLRSMWKTPRALMSIRTFQAFNDLMAKVDSPAALKERVEMLAFLHLQMDVTAPRIWLFRDALVDLLQVELGNQFQPIHIEAWSLMMSYLGGAFIFIRQEFAERLKVLLTSWEKVNTSKKERADAPAPTALNELAVDVPHAALEEGLAPTQGGKSPRYATAAIPKTFSEMFLFNAAVMGFGQDTWMECVLRAFGPIVLNIANTARLQEECDVLAILLARHKGPINLKDFKAVMLATLRSLLPSDWSLQHENAWAWVWETVERLLLVHMGKPAAQERALRRFVDSLSDEQRFQFKTKIYEIFFEKCPGGQDYFKQSTTRLHFIADKALAFTLDIFKDTHEVVSALSALGLRHVGYGIPTEFFPPFVSAAIEAFAGLTDRQEAMPFKDGGVAEAAVEAFAWSLGLVSRVLVRTINEGSTLVMKAINANDPRMLKKAVSCAPRGQRAQWVLQVQVGTEQISPLMWAISSGSVETARAILEDLFTIRADREHYYYAVDELFDRHPDIVERLRHDAPTLLEVLFNGFIWRSRVIDNGKRRVNYYIKHLVAEKDGSVGQSLASIVKHENPVIMCHPTVVLVFDNIWNGVAMKAFLFNKLSFLVSLLFFVMAQSFLIRYPIVMDHQSGRSLIFALRIWNYSVYFPSLVIQHARHILEAIKERDYVRLQTAIPMRIPAYLRDWQNSLSLILTVGLLLQIILEPTFECSKGGMIRTSCPAVAESITVYRWIAMFNMLMLFVLGIDFMVVSTAVSAYVLACGRVIFEVLLCVLGLVFNLVTFSCVICCMRQEMKDFQTVPSTMLALIRITLCLYSGARLDEATQYVDLFLFISIYTLISWMFLLNLLVGQMSTIYQATYSDMVGFARLNRGRLMLKTIQTVKPKRWTAFVESLRLDEKLEFNEGDIGLAGGLQCFEPANAHAVTQEQIKRFGGPTNPAAPWPEEPEGSAESDKLELLEKGLQKSLGKIWKAVASKGHSSAGGSSMSRISSTVKGSTSYAGGSNEER